MLSVAERNPGKVAFIFHKNDGLKLTYGQIKEKAVRLAQNFISMGLRTGDRIAFLLPNCYELVIGYLAGALLGLVLVPLDQDYGTSELELMIKKTEPVAICLSYSNEFKETADELFLNINAFPKREYHSKNFSNLKHLVFLQEPPKHISQNVWIWNELENELLNKETVHEFPKIDPEDAFAIVFTVITQKFLKTLF